MRFLTGLAMAAIMWALPHTPAAAQALSDAQEKAIEQLIADYFIKNPEKMADVLNNLTQYYEAKEKKEFADMLSKRSDEIFYSKDDFSMGPKDAPITIVEFFDYNCGYCKRAFAPLMQVLRENSDVRLVFKEFPILSDDSRTAARLALSIEDQLTFLTFHTKLMSHGGPINEPMLDKTLAELKLSRAELEAPETRRKAEAVLAGNKKLAQDLNINGTPAFLVNDTLYPGALDAAGLADAIATAREELKSKNR